MRISETLASASELALETVKAENPDARKFIDRHSARLQRAALASTDSRSKGPPDLKKIKQALRAELSKIEDKKVELAWLKDANVHPVQQPEPNQPDTDHSIALALYTALFVVVILAVVAFLPVLTTKTGGGLYHEQLVNSLAVKLRSR